MPLHDLVALAIQIATLIVLITTCMAIFKQVAAVEKLAEATERQIKLSALQAGAVREQVDAANRQVIEALRPIVVARVVDFNSLEQAIELIVRNESSGVALDVWWMYGEVGDISAQRNRVWEGILVPQIEKRLAIVTSRALAEGVVIAYKSLAGVTSATRITWKNKDWEMRYFPDISEWSTRLQGKLLESVPSY